MNCGFCDLATLIGVIGSFAVVMVAPETLIEEVVVDDINEWVGETEQDAIKLPTALAEEIAEGVLEVETKGSRTR